MDAIGRRLQQPFLEDAMCEYMPGATPPTGPGLAWGNCTDGIITVNGTNIPKVFYYMPKGRVKTVAESQLKVGIEIAFISCDFANN